MELKQFDAAVASYEKVIAIKPDYAEAYRSRGVALQYLMQLDAAVASYNQAIALKPDFVEAYLNRGNALKELKQLDAALASCDQAIALKPDFAEAYLNRGNALKDLKQFDAAFSSYEKAIALKPDYAEAYGNRGIALMELKQFDAAISSCDQAIALKPDYAEAYNNRGNALKDLKQLNAAVASYNKAIALKPDYAEAYGNRGISLMELKQFDAAFASHDKAIALKPDYADAYINRGVALQELKQLDAAVANYDKAIALKPDYALGNWNKALVLLLLGDFESGWLLYEWRWKMPEQIGEKGRHFSQPLWLGVEDIANKTILLHAEQGLGDTIQFCRYAKLVSDRGAKVILEVPKVLMGLLTGLSGIGELVEAEKALPQFDYHCPLLSLPLAFNTRLETIPLPTPYLSSNTEMLRSWDKKLGHKKAPRIGLVWSGSLIHKNDHNRSFLLAELIKILPPNCEYFSLQKEVREMDRVVLAQSNIKHYGDALIDFTDTAALCDLMDVVISVDTSVAHLAGGLGKKTWILLPYIPDWRWLLDRDDSPWYPSVKLYRQDNDRSWETVLQRVAADLQKLITG